MIGYWSYTVILTYLSLTSAFIGIALSVFYAGTCSTLGMILPISCLLLAGFCDLFDGRVARSKKNRTDDEKAFGIQIDSLCDLVAFTVFPATMGFCLGGNHILAAIAGASIILGGVIRLAYFNVEELKRQSDPNNTDHSYTGLPVTSTALLVPALFLFKDMFDDKFPAFFQIALIVISILFISKFKIAKPDTTKIVIMILAGVCILAALVKSWYVIIPITPFVAIAIYIFVKHMKKRKAKRAETEK